MSGSLPIFEKIHGLRGRRFLIKAETSSEASDYAKYDALRNAVWGFPEDHMAAPRNLRCENVFHEGGSLFLAAFAESEGGGFIEDEPHLVGFSYGFIGVRDKAVAFKSPNNLWFYAQYTCVLPAWRGYGLGVAIKELQREILSGPLGIQEIVCTYDPLTGVNANRNVHVLGMRVLDYRTATYGEYGGLLNRRDVPTDRFFMSLDLRRPQERPDLPMGLWSDESARVLQIETAEIQGKTKVLEIETVRSVDTSGTHPFRLVRIPLDFYVMLRETDVDDFRVRRIPIDWRTATRRAFLDLFAAGYRVVDFRCGFGGKPGNDYVLQRA